MSHLEYLQRSKLVSKYVGQKAQVIIVVAMFFHTLYCIFSDVVASEICASWISTFLPYLQELLTIWVRRYQHRSRRSLVWLRLSTLLVWLMVTWSIHLMSTKPYCGLVRRLSFWILLYSIVVFLMNPDSWYSLVWSLFGIFVVYFYAVVACETESGLEILCHAVILYL